MNQKTLGVSAQPCMLARSWGCKARRLMLIRASIDACPVQALQPVGDGGRGSMRALQVLHWAAFETPRPDRKFERNAPVQMTMIDSSQTDLFGEVPSPAPAAPGVARLKVLPSGRHKLSPAQQRFNKLLARVDNLGRHLHELQQLADKVRGPHMDRMAELERLMDEGRRKMLAFLHERLQRKGLTAAQQKVAREILQSLLPPPGLGDESVPELAELRAIYAPPSSNEDGPSGQTDVLREQMLDMAQDVLGDALDRDALADIDSPQAFMEALLQQARAHQEAQEERQAARRSRRPPTARQRKAQEQVQDAKAALRSIYRQLASALHPDREPDPAECERKSALMSQANAAYERGDLTALLRLQLQAEQVDAAHIAQMADDKLAALSLLLKEQVATLEGQLADAEMHLGFDLGVPVSARMSQALLSRLLQEEQEALAEVVSQMQEDLERVRDDAQLKRWLREQAALAREQEREDALLARLGGGFF